MLSHRTAIPLENIRCGYFDDKSCFTFTPRQTHIDCFDFYSFVPADQNRQTLFQQKPPKHFMPTIHFDEQGRHHIDIPEPPPQAQQRSGSDVARAPTGSFRIVKDGNTTTFDTLGIEKPESGLHLSTLYSWHLFSNELKSLTEIANLREMNESTISSHLSDAALDGLLDPLLVVNRQSIVIICECINKLPEDAEGRLKPIFLALKEEFDYGQIKCAIALGNRNGLILNDQYV
jgi:hypothetical protein